MATGSPPHDVEGAASYAPIPAGPQPEEHPETKKLFATIFFSSFLSLSLILLIINQKPSTHLKLNETSATTPTEAPSRGVAQGVSEKVFRRVSGGKLSFAWTTAMLTWQRTAYHFQPQKNWMNGYTLPRKLSPFGKAEAPKTLLDGNPNGPLFYNGWYHLFYQYNPDSAVWGLISWGHAISKDLINWAHLPLAMVPDQPYDINGVWTGSATILPDGRIVMLYTGDTHDEVQVQCVAYPANLSDPLLLDWVKDSKNPVLFPPSGIGSKDFRDPTTAWLSPDGDKWRVTIGSKVNKTGISLLYETKDFMKYELLDGYLHQVPGTGMWECVDFYPISLTEDNGQVSGAGIKHVLKASLDDDKNDYYALGTYDPIENKWAPDDPKNDVGIGLRYDYGKFYASKTFYDQNKKRRILWGWIRETDAESLDLMKGWAGLQSIPRSVVFDKKTGEDLLQWPVEEVESLRSDNVFELSDVKLAPGSIIPLPIQSPSQLDLVATFDVDEKAVEAAAKANASYDCPMSGGAINRGELGPFGVVVLADKAMSELTPIYFYIVKGTNGKAETHFCADQLRSSQASDVDKIVYGSKVPVLGGENLSLRSLVDHSIVESFAQGGRRVITSRVYPTKATNSSTTHVFLFNNATKTSVTASIKIWKMNSAEIHPFPFDQR